MLVLAVVGIALALMGIGAPYLGMPHLVGLAIFGAGVLLFLASPLFSESVRRRLRRSSAVPDDGQTTSLHDVLMAEIARGEALHRAARQPETSETEWAVDNFRRRGAEWYEGVSKVLGEHGENDRLYEWTGVSIWMRGRPRAGNPDEAKTALVDPLYERLQMLERYAREMAA